MGFSSKTGISLASGFKYQAKSPLDLRRVVDTVAERNELVTINAAWEGMHVYVKTDKKTYEYRGGTTWTPVLAGSMYTHPTYTAKSSGLYKVTVDGTGHVSATTAVTKSDITALGIPGSDTKYGVFKAATADAAGGTGLVPAPAKGAQGLFLRGDNVWAKPTDTTYNDATTSAHGLMTAADKTKLNGIATNANNYTHPASHPATMITQDATHRFLTDDERTKLAGIASGANKYVHPSYTPKASGLYKVTVDDSGHVSAATAVTKADITALGIPAQDTNTTYNTGTASVSGLTKLYTGTGSATDGTITQKAITDALNGKSSTTHTHNYAGSSSAGGAANSAAKLSTARTVSGGTDITMNFNYDGSGNSGASIGYYSSSVYNGNTNNYPFHRFAKLDTITSSYTDKTMTVLLTQDFNGGAFGIARISLRTNNVANKDVSQAEVKWLARSGFNADAIQIGIYNVAGATYADAFLKLSGTYAGTVIRAIANGARGDISRTWTLVNSKEADSTTSSDPKTSTECYANIATAGTKLHNQSYSVTVSGSDSCTTSYANSAGSASKATQDSAGQQINKTYIKNLSISGKTITYTKGDGTTGTIITQDTNTTYDDVTTSAHGLMTAADKVKLNGIAANANNYTHPTYTAKSSGLYKVTVDGTGHVSAVAAVTKADITALGIPGSDTNTWRGIQDNLTSTATDQSLSAYQGKLLNDKFGSYTAKSNKVSATLSASSWSGSGPYTITVSVTGVTASNNVEVLIPGSATDAQAEAWMAAGIVNGTQRTNSITLKAYGDKPSINIPIECIVRKDI